MVRECLIHKCLWAGKRVCCADCSRECKERCLNSPDRCGCIGSKVMPDPDVPRKPGLNPRMKYLSPQQRREIIALLQEGKLTQAKIAEMYGVTPSAVARYRGYVEKGDGHG